ncbi:cell adhesion molecule Dscam2-like [Uloborus diversus]|uniref:cell adhesion molecule Dscam2-like n=1 Tax=Uloborus diversus TaxID=327109 RepID=UPI0024094FCA|nr:cell adhesion molecule Dscam2-like [Uloborus diversus]
MGPSFLVEPPHLVSFTNDTGAVIPCSVRGHPQPSISWAQGPRNTLRDMPGLRHFRADGSLVFPPFASEDYRQGVHDGVYRCIASNAVGSIVSREVHVKAVVRRRYKVQVYDEFVVRGNTAVLRCQVPSFVRDHVDYSWKREDGTSITSSLIRGGRYSVLPSGELYIRSVTQADGQKSYSCQTRHRLTAEIVESSSGGRLFITEPHGTSPPKITDIRPLVMAMEGHSVELACAATGFPAPNYRWYRDEEGRMIDLASSTRNTQLGGSIRLRSVLVQDGGRYVCVVNNSAGDDRAATLLSISAPLSVQISPSVQTADVGRSATFNCTVSGHPIRTLTWLKDRRPILPDRIMMLSRDVLHIASVQREDRGVYQCLTSNEHDSAQGAAELRLGDVAPVLLATFAGEAVRPGSSVSLRCTASGNPLPQVTWFLDDARIPDALRFRVGDYVTSDGHVMSYVNISDVRVEDGGEYMCSAENAVTSTQHKARLDIYGPPFVRPMPNMSVVAGTIVSLKCPVSGYPIESIAWLKDGTTLPANHRQKLDQLAGRLLIHDVQRPADEGAYTCRALGADSRTAEGTLHVRVLVAPNIEPVMLPPKMHAKEGARTKLMCSITQGDPPIQISWRKNGFPVPLEKDTTIQSLEESSLLIFRKTASKHSGNYTCFASNEAATVNRTTEVIVNVPPKWIVEPKNSFAILGQGVVMDCVAEGYPIPKIHWKKATGSATGDFVDVLSRRQTLENGSLSLQEVGESDAGLYLCQALNGIGAGISKVVTLTIHTPPRFESKFISISVPKGQDAELRCEAKGDLPIQISWEKDKQPLDPKSIKRLSSVEHESDSHSSSILSIKGAGRTDSALYTCLASNPFGSDDTNIQLVVQEPPSAPVELNVKEKSSRSVTLSWSPSFSGNSPLTRYTIQYGNDSNEGMLEELSVSGSETTAVIRSLLPSHSYKFRIQAQNTLGSSEPGDLMTVTTDEEVPGGPPLDVEVRPTGSQSLKVTWKPPREDLQHGTIRGYYIGYRAATDLDGQYQYKNVESSGNSPELSYLTNLRRLTSYKIIVQAYNDVGAGPRSDEVTATTLEAAPPTSPVLSLHSTTSSSMTVTWERPTDDIGIREYVLYYKPEGGGSDEFLEQKINTPGSRYTLEGLLCGTGYRLYMTATNSLGTGEPSEIITGRTRGAAPVSPSKESFLVPNSTFVTLLLSSWQSGGCPILHFTVQLRGAQGHWRTVLERADPGREILEVRHLVPGREYTMRVSAHSEAGTTEAEYRFGTLNVTAAVPILKSGGHPPLSESAGSPFYRNLTVLLPPVIISVAVLVVVVIAVIVCLRKQVDTGSMSEDSRKSRMPGEHLGLAEFPPPPKNLKEHAGDATSYGGPKSSYYSSPARKPLAMASDSHRGISGDSSLTIKKYSGWS